MPMLRAPHSARDRWNRCVTPIACVRPKTTRGAENVFLLRRLARTQCEPLLQRTEIATLGHRARTLDEPESETQVRREVRDSESRDLAGSRTNRFAETTQQRSLERFHFRCE